MPGVSTSRIWLSPRIRIASTRKRVVCAFGLTIESFAPASRLSSVDLPAFGAPDDGGETATGRDGSRFGTGRHDCNSSSNASAASCSARRFEPAVPVPVRPATLTAMAKTGACDGPSREASAYSGKGWPRACAHSCSAVLASLGGAGCATIALLPGAAHEVPRRIEPAIEEERTDRCLGRVREHRRPPPHARLRLAGRDRERRRQPRLLGDRGEHGLRDQQREPAAELAFLLLGEPLREPFRDQQPEHAVAHELQPLVRSGALRLAAPLARRGAVRQRLAQQFRAPETMAEQSLGGANPFAGIGLPQ